MVKNENDQYSDVVEQVNENHLPLQQVHLCLENVYKFSQHV